MYCHVRSNDKLRVTAHNVSASTVDLVATTLAVHGAVCAERLKQANDRLGCIEIVLAAIVLLLVGEGSVIAMLRRMLCG